MRIVANVNESSIYEERKELLSMLSHELRNPLAAILSSVELLHRQETHPSERGLLLNTIEERVELITKILNRFLDSSHITEATPLFAAHTPPTPDTPHGPGRETRSVLIVDDNEAAARTLCRLLELLGYTVAVAFTGAEAITTALLTHPEIIILDIGLPDMDGYDVAYELQKEKGYSPKLIALTGYGQTEDKERALEAGFHLHLVKPVTVKEIEAAFVR